MRAWLLAILCCLSWPGLAQPPDGDGRSFIALALHDVVDEARDLDGDGVTSDRLVAVLDWLAGNGYTAITLDDIERARTGEKPLPARAVLLTADDGYRSLYTRIYPLAMAYRMPVVAALVTSWLDVPEGGSVSYGDEQLSRARFITWAQAREMQASGWIEFASHSHALHGQVVGNPQGNVFAAGVTRGWSAERGYEDDAAWRARISADLRRSRERMQGELGRAPRAMVWPFGRYTQDMLEAARALGFRFAMTLESAPASVDRPLEIARFLPSGDPNLGSSVAALSFRDPWPSARRLVCVDPAAFQAGDSEEVNRRLGLAIERLRRLGATHVLIDAVTRTPDGRIAASWFPNTLLPVRADLLSRLAAQMRSRAGVGVALRLPHAAALATLQEPRQVLRLFGELGVQVPFDALLVEGAPAFGQGAVEEGASADSPWHIAALRRGQDPKDWPASDALALGAFAAAARQRPGIELFWLAPTGRPLQRPAPLAELTLVPGRLDDAGPAPLRAPASRRMGVWWQDAPPDAAAIAAASRRLQLAGVTAMGWCPDDPVADAPVAAEAAPAWSGATFPRQGGRP